MIKCPWCKTDAVCEDHDDNGWFIGCVNGDCEIKPAFWGDGEEEALNIWNSARIIKITKPEPEFPAIGSRWVRRDHIVASGKYNGYQVIGFTNVAHRHPNHPIQVIYVGDNDYIWSLPLDDWPGKLTPEVTNIERPPDGGIMDTTED